MKLLLACSAGGHLAEMRQLEPFYSHYPHAFVTFERFDTKELGKKEKVYFITRPARNILSTLHACIEAWGVVAKENPSLIISTGADVTVPICIAGKLQGKKVIFIESFCRPLTPSVSGRIVSLFADRVIYQWPQLKRYYPGGILGGSIFSPDMLAGVGK